MKKNGIGKSMKLKKACEIAIDCGLSTIGEALMNIDMHAICIFLYSEIDKELLELYTEAKPYENNTKILDVFPELKEIHHRE